MPAIELYLVRHAIADERGPEWPNDAKRPLTEHGMARFKEGVRGLAAIQVEVDEIFTSAFVRAKQTAELLAEGLKGKPPVKTLKALEPGHGPAAAIQQLARDGKQRRIAIVGHEPALGELAAWLVGAGSPLPFKKGGVCRIDMPSLPATRSGTLVWMLPPKILRKLGR
jgi:phosphohistidine phosphatase